MRRPLLLPFLLLAGGAGLANLLITEAPSPSLPVCDPTPRGSAHIVPTSKSDPQPGPDEAESSLTRPDPHQNVATRDRPPTTAISQGNQSLAARRLVAFREHALHDAAGASRIALARLLSGETIPLAESETLLASLGSSTDPAAIRLLQDRVTHASEPRIRAAALQALVAADPPSALGIASSWAWSEPDPGLRRLVIRLLGRLEDPSAATALAEIAAAETDPRISDLARRVLRSSQSPSSR